MLLGNSSGEHMRGPTSRGTAVPALWYVRNTSQGMCKLENYFCSVIEGGGVAHDLSFSGTFLSPSVLKLQPREGVGELLPSVAGLLGMRSTVLPSSGHLPETTSKN